MKKLKYLVAKYIPTITKFVRPELIILFFLAVFVGTIYICFVFFTKPPSSIYLPNSLISLGEKKVQPKTATTPAQTLQTVTCLSDQKIELVKNFNYSFSFLRNGDLWISENGIETKILSKNTFIQRFPNLFKTYEFSKDNKSVFYIATNNLEKENLKTSIRQRFLTGEDKEIVANLNGSEEYWKRQINGISLSNDQTKLAYTQKGLWIKDLISGETTKIASSTYYDPEKGDGGHDYSDVFWVPGDKYLLTGASGYEAYYQDYIELNTKKVTEVRPPYFGDNYYVVGFISDNKAVYFRQGEGIFESGFPFDKKSTPLYNDTAAIIDSIVYFSNINTVWFTHSLQEEMKDEIYSFDLNLKKLTKITNHKELFKNVAFGSPWNPGNCGNTSNLSVTSDGKFISFNPSSAHNVSWIISLINNKDYLLMENGKDVEFLD